MTTRARVLWVLSILAAVIPTVATPMVRAEPNGGTTAVNSVVLFVDDLGWADLAYRLSDLPTPNIDRLRAEGMTFVNAYAASPTCSPSRATMLTGRSAARLRLARHIPHNATGAFHTIESDPARFPSRNWLPLEERTFAEALRDRGYRTAFVGKWHLGPEAYFPIHQGFDEQHGVTDRGQPRSYYPSFFGPDVETYADGEVGAYLTDRMTDDAIGFLERQSEATPFHLSVFYYAVHTPHVGRRDLVARLAESTDLEGAELEHAAMLLAVDESVGRARSVLERKGLSQDTLLLFVGDQGGPFDNSPLRGQKMGGTALYEGGSRVPFVAVWPGHIPGGTVVAAPVTTEDVFPTLVEASGVNDSDGGEVDGESLMPLLTGSGSLRRDQVVLYRSYESRYAAIRVGDWKLIAYRDGRSELYDLGADPSESEDVGDAHSATRRDLIDRLVAWERRMGVEAFTPPFDR